MRMNLTNTSVTLGQKRSKAKDQWNILATIPQDVFVPLISTISNLLYSAI